VRKIGNMHDRTAEAISLQQGVKFRISVPEIAADPPRLASHQLAVLAHSYMVTEPPPGPRRTGLMG